MNTALLVMDVQLGIVDRLDDKDDYISRAKAAVDAAHNKNIPVIYVVVGFRPGFPDVSSNNKSFKAMKETGSDVMLNPRPIIGLNETDIVVTKRRVSAFSGSDLEVILRSQGVTSLVLSGIATSGVVLSTVREAADKDFQLTVLSDLCSDFDETVNSVLLEKVFPKQAAVITSSEWIATLK
jgi:nicotinamidase-related amidase